uniref:Putative secreted protein n=1 Tax=Anopheles darlingi TaxID=43151 RepID=A0A2M4DJA1_ANODA
MMLIPFLYFFCSFPVVRASSSSLNCAMTADNVTHKDIRRVGEVIQPPPLIASSSRNFGCCTRRLHSKNKNANSKPKSRFHFICIS